MPNTTQTQIFVNNIILFNQESLSPAIIAGQMQAKLQEAWQYKRKECPDLTAKFEERIANYKARELISQADDFDRRTTLGNLYRKYAQKGDVLILHGGEYRPMSSVNRSRNNHFGYNWYYHIVFFYYPLTNTWDYDFYSHN